MATVSHTALPDADLHVCKGASGASAGQVIVFDGAGGQNTKYANPRGAVYFVNIGTPYTLTYPSTYAKAAPTTTAVGLATEYTEATTARLTYTGTDTLDTRVLVNMSVDQSIGANRDIRAKVYKTGVAVANSEVIVTTTSGEKHLMAIIADVSLATNDYLEVYMQNDGASGDINIYSFYLTAFSMRG